MSYTVNSLLSDHPWCTRKWSLTRGGRLREQSTKYPSTDNDYHKKLLPLLIKIRQIDKGVSITLTREFLKQYLTEKQKGYFQSGRLREVVAMRELTVPCY